MGALGCEDGTSAASTPVQMPSIACTGCLQTSASIAQHVRFALQIQSNRFAVAMRRFSATAVSVRHSALLCGAACLSNVRCCNTSCQAFRSHRTPSHVACYVCKWPAVCVVMCSAWAWCALQCNPALEPKRKSTVNVQLQCNGCVHMLQGHHSACTQACRLCVPDWLHCAYSGGVGGLLHGQTTVHAFPLHTAHTGGPQ